MSKTIAYSQGWASYAWNCCPDVRQLENPYYAPCDEYTEWERGYSEAKAKDEETGHL